ncbi:hypothetical protein E2C01_063846 [Portunus trituberculatus]|uniref:Uncharacterized protein n=1 Tax=Portunus trituberculatus TaxID=210409 RepID=A0A5B7HI69_PORTR|nr:hypothetical protein [Portunus trituberculatus]
MHSYQLHPALTFFTQRSSIMHSRLQPAITRSHPVIIYTCPTTMHSYLHPLITQPSSYPPRSHPAIHSPSPLLLSSWPPFTSHSSPDRNENTRPNNVHNKPCGASPSSAQRDTIAASKHGTSDTRPFSLSPVT